MISGKSIKICLILTLRHLPHIWVLLWWLVSEQAGTPRLRGCISRADGIIGCEGWPLGSCGVERTQLGHWPSLLAIRWGCCTSETCLRRSRRTSLHSTAWMIGIILRKQQQKELWSLASVKLPGKEQKEIYGGRNCFPKCGKSKAGMRPLLQPSFATFQRVPSCLPSVMRVIDKHPGNLWPEPWAMGTCPEEPLDRKAALVSLLPGLLYGQNTLSK